MKKRLYQVVLTGLLSLACMASAQAFVWENLFRQPDAQALKQQRLQDWQQLIEDARRDNEWQRLNRVNRFFNQITYKTDADLWGKADYWATPREFLSQGAGDCEDYAIAKYLTLKTLGVPDKRLFLTHVTLRSTGQQHMVLLYREADSGALLVLDNRNNRIRPFTGQSELIPIYSFNDASLWLTFPDAQMQPVGPSTQVSNWVALREKYHREQLPQQMLTRNGVE